MLRMQAVAACYSAGYAATDGAMQLRLVPAVASCNQQKDTYEPRRSCIAPSPPKKKPPENNTFLVQAEREICSFAFDFAGKGVP
eukprot:61579-Rhodomonas_salina.1